MNSAAKNPLYGQESLKLGKDDIRVLILLPDRRDCPADSISKNGKVGRDSRF